MMTVVSIANFEAKVKKTADYGIVNPSSILRTSMKRLYAMLLSSKILYDIIPYAL